MKTKKLYTKEPVEISQIDIALYRKEQIIFYTCKCGKVGKTSIARYLRIPTEERNLCFSCKQEKSRLQLYGNPHFRNHEKAKATKKVKYGNENFVNKEKGKQTCLEKYGSTNYLSSKEGKEKTKEALQKKYGVEHPAQAQSVKEKMQKTSLERYGTKNPLSNKTVKDKVKSTRFQRFGAYAPKDFGEKCKKTNLERHGIANYNNLEKRKQTCLERYGVESPMQCAYIFAKNKRKIFYKNEYWDSRWEIIYFEYEKSLGRNIQRNTKVSFDYVFNGKKHKYFPDFIIDNSFVEIKGDQFFDKDEKMINPYDSLQNGLYEAKHQCMLQNNVKILKREDLQEAFEWIKHTDILKELKG